MESNPMGHQKLTNPQQVAQEGQTVNDLPQRTNVSTQGPRLFNRFILGQPAQVGGDVGPMLPTSNGGISSGLANLPSVSCGGPSGQLGASSQPGENLHGSSRASFKSLASNSRTKENKQ